MTMAHTQPAQQGFALKQSACRTDLTHLSHQEGLLNIEKAVLEKFLTIQSESHQEHPSLSDIAVSDRTFTGGGFITDFCTLNILRIGPRQESYQFSDISATINADIDTGYVIYIENGYIKTLEGFTYEADWPDHVASIRLNPCTPQ